MKKKLLDILDNLEIRELEKVKEMVSESLSCLKMIGSGLSALWGSFKSRTVHSLDSLRYRIL